MFNFDEQFARNGANFTLELFNQLTANEGKENIVFSPFSIQLCGALAYLGADGETAAEIVEGLKFVSDVKPEVTSTLQFVLQKYKDSPILKIANKMYVQNGHAIKLNYETSTKEIDAESETVNFGENVAAANSINSWVASKTNDKIKELISADSINDLTRLVLLNAIYFKGSWAHKFDESCTAEDDFWVAEEESVKLHYMNQKSKFAFGYFEELNCNAIDLPYKDTDLSMLVLLPSEREGLKPLAEKLKEVNLVELADKMSTEEVEVKLPKFKVEYTKEMNEALKNLGIQKMFTDSAEFSQMLESPEGLHVSSVLHKAYIEVNEEGTEAAAATGMIMMTRCMMLPLQFQADRPFLYFIWNKKNVLFAGAFVTPS